MKRPSFQFYPSDWVGNSNLKRCTHAEKGVWLEIMCLLHDSEEYGLLRWPLKEIVEAVKCKPADARALVSKGVLKGSDTQLDAPFVYTPRSGRKDGEPVTLVPTQAGPVWFSSRMVKDEYVRTIRGESTRFGDELSEAPKRAPKPPFGDGSSSSSSSSSSESANALSARDPDDPNTPTPEPPTTRAGAVCRRMKAAGLTAVNPAHPKLAALLAAGITDAELEAAAADAAQRGKGFAYALAAAEGQRRDAAVEPLPDRASITVPSRAGPDPALQRLEADRAAWKPPAPEVKAMIAQTVERLKARAS